MKTATRTRRQLAEVLQLLPRAAAEQLWAEATVRVRQKRDAARGFTPHKPHPAQKPFVENDTVKEMLYGGAAGGGKTDALLMAALRYVHVPRYSAVIFRRTFPMLDAADGLIERSLHWLMPTGAKWNSGKHKWTFPSGATLTFAHLQYYKDVEDHQGAAYQFIGWDELTQFEERQYRYLFSRCRRPKNVDEKLSTVPLRIRATSNPGGVGHDWVKKRFISKNLAPDQRIFVPAKVADNPSLDQEAYIENLMELDPVTRAQLLHGDWDAAGDQLLDPAWLNDSLSQDSLWPVGTPPAHLGRVPELYVGVDIGRTQHRTVIAVVERWLDLFWLRALVVLHNTPFSQQKEAVLKWVNRRDVVKVHFDKGGIGMEMAEYFETNFPGRCEGVQLTPGRQGQIAQAMQIAFQEKHWRIHEDDDLHEDLQLVRKVSDQNGVPVVHTNEGQSGHADRFWAMGLALFGVPHRPHRRVTRGPRGTQSKLSRAA